MAFSPLTPSAWLAPGTITQFRATENDQDVASTRSADQLAADLASSGALESLGYSGPVYAQAWHYSEDASGPGVAPELTQWVSAHGFATAQGSDQYVAGLLDRSGKPVASAAIPDNEPSWLQFLSPLLVAAGAAFALPAAGAEAATAAAADSAWLGAGSVDAMAGASGGGLAASEAAAAWSIAPPAPLGATPSLASAAADVLAETGLQSAPFGSSLPAVDSGFLTGGGGLLTAGTAPTLAIAPTLPAATPAVSSSGAAAVPSMSTASIKQLTGLLGAAFGQPTAGQVAPRRAAIAPSSSSSSSSDALLLLGLAAVAVLILT